MNKMSMFFVLVFIFFINTPLSLYSLSLDDYIDHSIHHHPLFLREDLNVDIEQQQLLSIQGDEDWRSTFSPSLSYKETLNQNAFAVGDTHTLSADASLSRPLWSTGGSLNLRLTGTRTLEAQPLFDGAALGPDRFYETGISVSYTQPLLRNWSGILSRLNRDIQSFNVNIARFQSEENKELFIETLITHYLELVFLTEQVRIVSDRLALAKAELSRTRKQWNANLVTRVDLLRSEDAVQIAEQNMVLVIGQLEGKEAQVGTLISLPTIKGDALNYNLYTFPTLPPLSLSKDDLQEVRFLSILDVNIDQAKRRLAGSKNALQPDVYITLSGGVGDGDAESENAVDFDKSNASIALTYEFPWENRTAIGEHDRNKATLQQLEYQYEENYRDLEGRRQQLVIELRQLRKVLALNQEQIQSAERKTAEERVLYNQGRSQYTFVIQAQDNEANARLNFAQNAQQFHRLYYSYLSLTDTLFNGTSVNTTLR